MYANLRVTITKDDGESTVYYAHEVHHEDGHLVVLLDSNDGEQNHAEPAGEVSMGPTDTIRVTADF